MKAILQTLALVLVAGLSTATAQNAQFQGTPTVTDQGTTLKVCGKLTGLGNVSMSAVAVTITALQTVTTTCTNPGGNVAPGLTQTGQVAQTGQFLPSKNGTVTFCLTTEAPTPGQCPNGQFTGTVTDASFSNVKVFVNGVQVPF